MTGLPHIIAVTVYDTDGTTVMPNLKVTARLEASNESLVANTNESGEVLFNLANLPSGYSVGDIVTLYVLYLSYESSTSYVVESGGGTTLTLTLTAIPSAPTLRYFTPQDFMEYFDVKTYQQDTENGIKMVQLVKIGEVVESGIDDDTGTRFDPNNVIEDYYDAESKQSIFYLRYTPVISVDGFWVNRHSENSTPLWDNLAYTLHHGCATTTDWTASSTNSEVTLNVNYLPANANGDIGCLFVVKSGTNDTTLTLKVDLVSSEFTDKTFKIDLYFEDTSVYAETDAVILRFGSDSGNYFEKKFNRSDINNGWNTLTMYYKDSGLTATGSPDITDFDWFTIVLELADATTEIAAGEARIDNLRYEDNTHLSINNSLGRVMIRKSIDYPVKGLDQVKVVHRYGRTEVPGDIKELALLETALRMFGAAFLKSKIKGRDADMETTSWFDSYRMRIITKYNVTGVDSI